MLSRLIRRSPVGKREPKILAQDVKDELDEPVSKLVEHDADEARYRDSDRCVFPAGSAVLYPSSPQSEAGTGPAGKPRSPQGGSAIRPAGSLRSCGQPGELGPVSRSKSSINDPMLLDLIHQALVGNQELKILTEDVQIASNEILARKGAYLPFIYPGAARGGQIQQLHAPGSRRYATTRISPGSSFPIRCRISCWASPSYGRRTSGGSCIMPGTRRRCATTPRLRGGTSS